MTNVEMIAGALVLCLSPIALLLVVMYLYKVKKILSYIESNHQNEWREIGKMTLLFNNSIKSTFLFVRWLVNKKYMSLHDEKLISMGRNCRALFIWSVGVILTDQLMVLLILMSS